MNTNKGALRNKFGNQDQWDKFDLSGKVLLPGQLGIHTGVNKIKCGDGIHKFAELPFIGGSGGSGVPIGGIIPWSSEEIPPYFMECNGAALIKSDFSDLFGIIGYEFGGSGDTFNLPDLRGRVPVGKSNDSGSTWYSFGQFIGTEKETLTVDQMPVHNHEQKAHSHTVNAHTHAIPHTHDGTTGNQSNSHTHSFSGTTSTTGNHDHAQYVTANAGGGGSGTRADYNNDATGLQKYAQGISTGATGNHSHTYSGTTSGVSQNHTHSFTTGSPSTAYSASTSTNTNSLYAQNLETGGGESHNNIQPSLILKYIIKVSADNETSPGIGIPPGGEVGFVLTKRSADDYDVVWRAGGGGSGGGVIPGGLTNQVLAKISNESYDVGWVTINKQYVGLDKVDNTADIDKPVSTAVQTALNSKLNITGGEINGNLTINGNFIVNETNSISTKYLRAQTDLYLNYQSNGKIYLGTTAGHFISADGAEYSGKSNMSNFLHIFTTEELSGLTLDGAYIFWRQNPTGVNENTIAIQSQGGFSRFVFETAIENPQIMYRTKTASGTFDYKLYTEANPPKWTDILEKPTTFLPAGGTTGQALVKNSDEDFDSGWKTMVDTEPITGVIDIDVVINSNKYALKSELPISGSNDNGNWIKYSDGTMMQWGQGMGTTDNRGYLTVTFPQSFSAPPSVFMVTGTAGSGIVERGTRTTTTGEIIFRNYDDGSVRANTSSCLASWLAIGRWE